MRWIFRIALWLLPKPWVRRWLGSELREIFDLGNDNKIAVFDPDKLVAALQEMDHDNRTVWTLETDDDGRGVALCPNGSFSNDESEWAGLVRRQDTGDVQATPHLGES